MTRPTFSDSEDDLGLSSESEAPKSPANVEGQVQDGLPEQVDLRGYGKSIGVDLDIDQDLQWVVEEAFAASLPGNWIEYADSEGRVYFFNQVTEETSWFHPMDSVFRELLALIKKLRAESPPAPEASRLQAIHEHLLEVHERARSHLDGWSGPYSSEAGPYFFSEKYNASTWYSPIDQWQVELALRHRVLQRGLLLDWHSAASSLTSDTDQLVELPHLTLGLERPSLRGAAERPRSPSSARSFLSARSVSARSTQSLTPRKRSLTPTGRTLTARTPRSPDASSQAALAAGAAAAAAEAALVSVPLQPMPIASTEVSAQGSEQALHVSTETAIEAPSEPSPAISPTAAPEQVLGSSTANMEEIRVAESLLQGKPNESREAEAAAPSKQTLGTSAEPGATEKSGQERARLTSRSPTRRYKPSLTSVPGSPPVLGSPVRVATSGRVGKIIAEDVSELPYKVLFDDGDLPQADWVKADVVEVLDKTGEGGADSDRQHAGGSVQTGGDSAVRAAASRWPPEPLLTPASTTGKAVGEDGEELEFTFGSTRKLELPKFGT